LPFITTWDDSRNQNRPTDSAEEALKDSAKAAAVVRKHSSSADAFESLTKAAKNALSRLPFAVREALYYRARGEEYYPDPPEAWDDVKRAIENGQLKLNSEDTAVIPRESDPGVRKAATALDELEKWLERPPADFPEWYATAFDDARADVRLRPFWEEHLK
jgi:RNA processing factor Prp31